MSTASPNLASVATTDSAVTAAFARHRIDFHHHGFRPLGEHPAGPRAASARLDRADIGALIGHILAHHHTYLRRELPRLDDLVTEVQQRHGEMHGELDRIADLLSELSTTAFALLQTEESEVFPFMLRLLGAVARPAFDADMIETLETTNHGLDRVEVLLDDIRRFADDFTPPADSCAAYRALYAGLAELEADTRRHIHLEGNLLVPAIVDLFESLD